MRVEDRTGVMKPEDDKTPNIILICEDEAESKIVDLLGKPGQKVTGELHLSDGYCEFYIRLGPQFVKTHEFTKKVREFIIRKTAVNGVDDIKQFLAEYGGYMVEALEIIDNQNTVIYEAIERMDEEPAKEILRMAVI